MSVNAIVLGTWIEALRPVRSRLSAPITTVFKDAGRPESEHTLATSILAEFADDDPERLAELLVVADPKAYLSLFPLAARRAEKIVPVLRAELRKKLTHSWNDPPLELNLDRAGPSTRAPGRAGTGDRRRAVSPSVR